jgi:predicted O-methyltransferase YrrM
MIIHDSIEKIYNKFLNDFPGGKEALTIAQPIKSGQKHYQALALYGLAGRYNYHNSNILELGTAAGYSAAMIAQGAPLARITTLNPRKGEYELAKENLKPFPNVQVIAMCSWDYDAVYWGPYFDFIFVDGNHGLILRDMPWFNRLKVGGTILFHDYGPVYYIPIYEAVNNLTHKLGRSLDIMIMDTDTQSGMAGLTRKEGEYYG